MTTKLAQEKKIALKECCTHSSKKDQITKAQKKIYFMGGIAKQIRAKNKSFMSIYHQWWTNLNTNSRESKEQAIIQPIRKPNKFIQIIKHFSISMERFFYGWCSNCLLCLNVYFFLKIWEISCYNFIELIFCALVSPILWILLFGLLVTYQRAWVGDWIWYQKHRSN